jgi:hypothetical protein
MSEITGVWLLVSDYPEPIAVLRDREGITVDQALRAVFWQREVAARAEWDRSEGAWYSWARLDIVGTHWSVWAFVDEDGTGAVAPDAEPWRWLQGDIVYADVWPTP